MGLLIRGATAITQDESRSVLKCDIRTEGSLIAEVGKGLKREDEEEIDASGKIAFPGLINTHTHAAMSLLRGYGEDLPLQQWLTTKIWPAEAKLERKDIYWGTLLAALEMVRSGTTCFNDMYVFGMDKMAEAVIESGMRAVLARGMLGNAPDRGAEPEFREAVSFAERWMGKHERIKPAIAPHSPYMCDAELLERSKEWANGHGLPYHMHASETRKEVMDILKEKGKRPFEYFESLGMLDERTLLSHAGWVSKREILLAGRKKISIANCPISNLKLGTGGICPVPEFHERGANVTLATDGAASNNSLSMLETMKFCHLLQSHQYWDPAKVDMQHVWDFATRNGAQAMEINAGSIEQGKLADIVLADAHAPNLLPLHKPVLSIIYSISPANVTDVIINGERVLSEGKFTTLDEERVKEKATGAAFDLVNR